MSKHKNIIQLREEISEKIMGLHLKIDEFYNNIEIYTNAKNELIKDSFYYHLSSNEGYRKYAEKLNLSEDIDRNSLKIEDIPLLPSSFFKRSDMNLLSVPMEEIIKYCQSSGTSGSLSIVPRDEFTLTNFLGSISSILPAIFGLDRTGNQKGFVLGPNSEEAGDLWFSYVISCVSLLMQAECMEEESVIDLDYTSSQIRQAIIEGKNILIIGPPFKILELSEKIAQLSDWPEFPSKSYIISAGGWKNRQRESINDKEYRQLIRTRFKMESETSIRDIYNMVELNTVLPECEYHSKHIPPWVEVIIRNPSTNEKLENGQVGIISFLDASSISYPGFILSEDIGYVQTDECPCGRKGQTLKIVRRMNNIESRGCALKMAVGYDRVKAENSRFIQSFYRNPNKYL